MINTEEKKAPEARQVQWFDDRFYVVLGEKGEQIFLPSVTTILGVTANPFLARWRGDVGNREADYRRDQAGDRGSRIHHSCYTLLKGGKVIFQPQWQPNFSQDEIAEMRKAGPVIVLESQEEHWALCKWAEWVRRVSPEIVGAEMIVYSLENGVAGTLDYAIRVAGGKFEVAGREPLALEPGLYVVDLKTGRDLDDDAEIQVSAYAVMLSHMFGEVVQGGLLVHLSASTKAGIEGLTTRLVDQNQIAQNWADFLRIRDIWVRKNSTMKPTVRLLPAMVTLGEVFEAPKAAPDPKPVLELGPGFEPKPKAKRPRKPKAKSK